MQKVVIKTETRGRKPLLYPDKLADVPLRLYPREIAQIDAIAASSGRSKMAVKREAITQYLANLCPTA